MTTPLYSSESPAGKILGYLRRHGEGSVKDLEGLLEISTTAVREHLAHLQAKELLATRVVRNGPGRPRQVYFLTPKAQNLFPNDYDRLINLLLQEIASQEGSDRLDVLLDAVGTRLAEEYRGLVSGGELAERLEKLRDILEARGVPTDLDPSGGGLQIFACPYRDVAQKHAAVCSMERRMLEQVLGETIELEGSIREGQRSCHFTLVNKE